MFANPYRYLFILLLSAYSFLNTLAVEVFEYYPIQLNRSTLIFIFFLTIFLIWESNRLIERFFQKEYHTESNLIRTYLLRNFASSLILTLLISLLIGTMISYFWIGLDSDKLILPMKLYFTFSFRINLFLNVINLIFLYVSQLKKAQAETENFKKITYQAKLQAIRNQINPHFLFNNLNVLSALITKDTETSIEFVRQFAKVYRYVLKSNEKEIIELATELDFIESYTYLLKKRFGTGLKISVKVDESLRHRYIVPMALQMLIENAIKHNVISSQNPLYIDIFNTDDEKLIIQNNLQVRRVDMVESTQLGLQNISHRYRFLGKDDIEVIKTDLFFKVTIPLIRLTAKPKEVQIEEEFLSN